MHKTVQMSSNSKAPVPPNYLDLSFGNLRGGDILKLVVETIQGEVQKWTRTNLSNGGEFPS